MGAFSQLRLLLWKNLLTQIRSPWFTAFEFLLPLLLLGSGFGLMIGLRSKFEKSHNITNYNAWMVTGSVIDFFVPDYQETIIETDIILTGKLPKCPFLNYKVVSSSDLQIQMTVAYAPKNTNTTDIMNRLASRYTVDNLVYYGNSNHSNCYCAVCVCIADYCGCPPIDPKSIPTNLTIKMSTTVTGYSSEDDMVKSITDSFTDECNNPLIGGIVFNEDFANNPANTKNIGYKIRLANSQRNNYDDGGYWNTKELFVSKVFSGPSFKDDMDGGSYPGYWREGFLTLQRAVDMSIGHFLKNDSSNAMDMNPLHLERFPFPAYDSKIIEIGALFLPTIISFSFLTSVIYIVRSIVMEKENRLKEYMKVMGLSQWIHWLGYFIINYAKLMFLVVILTVCTYIVTEKSDPSIELLLYLIYTFDALYFAFLISTFFQSGTAATMVAVFAWMVLYFHEEILMSMDANSPYSQATRMFACINPNVALSFGLKLLAQYETQSSGLHWSSIGKPVSPDTQMTMADLFLMLIIDGILFMLLTGYVEAVHPGGEGVAQRPWFFVLPSYWFPGWKRNKKTSFDLQNGFHLSSNPNIEKEPPLNPTINVANLSKTYGNSIFKKLFECKFGKESEKLAVNQLNLKLYHSQVTALLGHNGAGKSTTFSMLTGVIPPTAGTAYINDFDIRDALPEIRKSLGLCPQYNILFNNLTVMEHLEFFCKLKNRPWSKIEGLNILQRLKIDFKAEARASTLSGGQKRKLSLAIALIGGSEIVMLDEPTSGMDPGARHETWTLLQSEKHNRTMLLTTHYMEEADLLGDRIAIMSHGELQCCGSSMFLKNIYGAGYHLVVVYKRGQENYTATLNLLKTFCPDAEMHSSVGAEATFLLASHHRPRFPEMFKYLEGNQESLGIESFGVSITTMEEVFLKVNELADERKKQDDNDSQEDSDQDLNQLRGARASRRLTGFPYYLQHFKAMFIKRSIYFLRKWTQFIPQLIIPVLYLGLFVWGSKLVPNAKVQDPLPIDLGIYASDGKPANVYITNLDNWPNGSSFFNFAKQVITDANPGVDFTNITDSLNCMLPTFGVPECPNMANAIVDATKDQGTVTFGLHNPVAFTPLSPNTNTSGIRALFNNWGEHSPALALNLADNMIMRTILPDITLSVTNHPLPPASGDSLKNDDNSSASSVLISYAMIVAISLVVSGYASFLIRERKKKAKHMQMMSGIRPWLYWLTSAIWDGVCYLIPVVIFIGIFAVFDIKEYTHSAGAIFSIFFILILFGWAAIPLVYTCSFGFNSAPRGYTMIVLLNVITGIIGTIAVPIIKGTSGDSTAHTVEVIFSLFFPTYALSNGMTKIYNNEFARISCEKVDCSNDMVKLIAKSCCGTADEKAYISNVFTDFGQKGCMYVVIFLILEGFLFWFTTIALENNWFSKLKRNNKVGTENQGFDADEKISVEDSDVMREKEELTRVLPANVPVLVRDLRKWYGNFNAVKGINFHVKESDCFGLLGVNGAGKTTTFQMLTGENAVSSGDAYIQGYSVQTDWRKAGEMIGYCPQYDAIIKELTGEETLYMFARIRGIPEDEIPTIVDAIIDSIGIRMYAKRQIKTYSGGNKRRLSLGMALVGLPEVLLLDEPTTGVDPKARRVIWDILSKVREFGSSLILTSHSMEECEALCTNLAIMVYGQFKCLGSPQHIKSKYGAGYTLLVRLESPQWAKEVKREIRQIFPGSVLKEEHVLQLNFELRRTEDQTWSSLFSQMEQIAERLHIVDYSLSQTTLEQIFLEFSREAGVLSKNESNPSFQNLNGTWSTKMVNETIY
uniref:ABC transporter domain-containing protein n=1 Tax=Acrobeloides nanus TaxID=290746 RepID=A0A914E137_9BILA